MSFNGFSRMNPDRFWSKIEVVAGPPVPGRPIEASVTVAGSRITVLAPRSPTVTTTCA